MSDNAYIGALRISLSRYQAELSEIRAILAQRGELSPDTLSGWRKIIGLRNALVHDYLNIDPEIIRSMIGQGYSDQLFTFGNQGLEWLASRLD